MWTLNRYLRRAIKNGNRIKILMLLKRLDINLKARDKQGNTVLHLVLQNERLTKNKIVELLKIFLDRDADPNIQNCRGESVLCLAVTNRRKSVIDLLMKYIGSISENISTSITCIFIRNEHDKFWATSDANDDSITRLRETMEIESPSFVEWLISKGFDFNRKRGEYFSPLYYATKFDLLHVLPVMLKHSTRKEYFDHGETLLHAIFRISNWSLLNHQVDSVWYHNYRSRHVSKIAKILLDQGISAVLEDYRGSTPIREAINAKEDVGIIEILVNHVPDGCDERRLASSLFRKMVSAQWSGSRVGYYLNILDDLIARGADVDCQDECGRRPIHRAVKIRNVDAVEYLKEKEADFFSVTNRGDNLLHALAEKNYEEVTRENAETRLFDLLISEGCQVNLRNFCGDTPLHVASSGRNTEIVRKLIDHGAIVNCVNNDLQTPLHLAAKVSNEKVIQCLLDAGAEVNSRDIEGPTPLHLAAAVSRANEVLRLLWNRGAHLNVRNKKGDTALAIAFRNGDDSNAQELVELGTNLEDSCISTGVMSLHGFYRTDFLSSLARRCLKMKAAKLPYPKEFLKMDEQQKFYDECLEEIEMLKVTFIDSCTSLYQLLHVDLNYRCMLYINNEKLKNIVESPTMEKNFPKYSTLIQSIYREAVTRKPLLELAKNAWFEITNIALPDICVERIVGYLSNDDLVTMLGDG